MKDRITDLNEDICSDLLESIILPIHFSFINDQHMNGKFQCYSIEHTSGAGVGLGPIRNSVHTTLFPSFPLHLLLSLQVSIVHGFSVSTLTFVSLLEEKRKRKRRKKKERQKLEKKTNRRKEKKKKT